MSSSSSSSSSSSAGPVPLLAEDAAARAYYVPFTYGTVSTWLGKKPGSSDSSFKWTVYVRSPDGHDLSYAIAKVVFGLHPTFPNPSREITSPPFAVTEVGWGAFDIPITIYLKDPATPPITVIHKLRLYTADNAPPALDRAVVEDHYEELVFNDLPADEKAREELLAGPKKKQPPFTFSEHLPDYSAAEDLARIKAASAKILKDSVIMKDRLLRRQDEAAKMAHDLRSLGFTL